MQKIWEQLEKRLGLPAAIAIVALVCFLGYSLLTSGSDDKQSGSGTTTTSSTTTTLIPAATTTTIAGQRKIDGFPEAALAVTKADGSTKKYCVAVAATAEQQAKGMMERTDFGGYDGMAFPFEADSKAAFYMANVKIPLQIGFFDGSGKFVSSQEMPLCTVQAKDCPRYNATAPFRYALEVNSSGLNGLGAGTGSSISLGGACA